MTIPGGPSADADVVVAGAGHNSLIAAAYLTLAGRRCLVLDARATPGGGVASEELLLPGFRLDSCSTGHTLIQTNPLLVDDELGLIAERGLTYLQPDPVAHVVFPDGESLTMWLDLERTCEEIARFSRADEQAYRRLLSEYDAVKDVFNRLRFTPVGLGPSAEELLQGRDGEARWRRRAAMSAWAVIRLYQTGGTTHPGGSVTGGPGRNAAIVMLSDLGEDLDAVVKRGRARRPAVV